MTQISPTISPTQRAAGWLARFEAAAAARDAETGAALFDDECYWRDLVSFTWNIRTFESRADIHAMLAERLGDVQPSNFKIEG